SVRAGAPITSMVVNHGGLATYPGGYPLSRELVGPPTMSGNYAMIAEGLGAVGITVTQPSEIAPALKRAQTLNAEGKGVLIDVHSNLEGRRSSF
ncbi:MAG: hypothetical protein J4G01_09625, partial [Dehalococcoidia bacterium]|nr:hypothetical protein [Dehalococcoidia bacterium]